MTTTKVNNNLSKKDTLRSLEGICRQKAQLLRRWRLDPSIPEHAIQEEMDELNIHYAELEDILACVE